MKPVQQEISCHWQSQWAISSKFTLDALHPIDNQISYDVLSVGDTIYDQVTDDAGVPVEAKP